MLRFYFVLVVDVVDFVRKVPYEGGMKKNESYREIFKTAKIHHNPPQKLEVLYEDNG